MAYVPPHDRVFEHSTSNSQTVFTVTGAVDTSYNAFSASMSVGDTTIGGVVEPGVAFKTGILTYSNTNEVTVAALESKGTFSSSGTKDVFMGLPALRAFANSTATPEGRLTLTSGVAITTSDVTGATSVYYTPSGGAQIALYDGSSWVQTLFSELTLALDSNAAHGGYQYANENFDLFVFNDSGTIRLGSGPGWVNGAVAGSATARATGAGSTEIQFLNGIPTNKNSITLRWGAASGNTTTIAANKARLVGTIRTTADGVTEDSQVKRFLSNVDNVAWRPMLRQEATASWNYSTASYRQANASASNQIAYVSCLAAGSIEAQVITVVLNSTATPRVVYAGIGVDSTTVNGRTISDFTRIGDGTLSSSGGPRAWYRGAVQIGYHYLAWLEKGNGTDTQTWFGVSGSDYQTGIFGGIYA